MSCCKVKTTRSGGVLTVNASRIGGGLCVQASNRCGNLQVHASLVCTSSLEGKFLQIEPEYVWLFESNQFTADVEVRSNADWETE